MPLSGLSAPEALAALLEELPVGVWVARAPMGEFVYANGAFARIMGMRARDDVRAGEWSEGYKIRDREGRPFPEEQLPFVQALHRREPVMVDGIVIERADGTGVDVRAFGKPLFDAAGTLTHVVVVFVDITAEVHAQAATRLAQERLHTALQHAPVILFAYDQDGRITVSEGAGLKALGVQSGELVGRTLQQLYGDNPVVMDNHRRVLDGDSFTSTTDLGVACLETWLGPIRDARGDVSGVIGVATDVTERLRMQRQATQNERLAAMGRLAASVGHEINNPLAFATEALRLAREPGTAGPQVEELLRDVADGLERIRLITRDLKAFSRADEGARAPQDLGRALAMAAKLVATRTAPRARLEVASDVTATILAEETRLVQIFVNLILNAVDAFPGDGPQRNRITIRPLLEGATAVIVVEDNGPGIAAEARDRVFEPFFTTKPTEEGTGLGLFITRNLIEALGGSITVGEAPGGGASFKIRLPTVAAPPAVAAPPPAVVPAPRVRRRILIIDDEPQIAEIFRRALQKDYEVQVFTSGRAALDHLLEGPVYDLVLCDLMMADVSGMKLHEELARWRPGLERSMVFMTGGVFDPGVAEFLASIPNECLDKPFDVRGEIRRLLSSG